MKWDVWVAMKERVQDRFVNEGLLLEDAEVIRHQDIIAAPIFHHYASSIETVIELAQHFGVEVDEDQLRSVAEHFMEAAMASERHQNHKLPD
jgi:hypothetical protein